MTAGGEQDGDEGSQAPGWESGRFRLLTGGRPVRESFARAVREGLSAPRKRLPCAFFYDQEGARLFEEICGLREYYLTGAERAILDERAGEIARALPSGAALVELGSGSADKTRLLIEELLRRQGRLLYVPLDICRPALERSARLLLGTYEGLEVLGIAAEYAEGLDLLPADGAPRLILSLGSNLGNFHRPEAAAFLRLLAASLDGEDRILLGLDLRKDPAVLVSAYDDSRGVTARFNRNLLARINRELGGRFDLQAFLHRVVYRQEPGRIEMHLESAVDQEVEVEALGTSFPFRAGERIHTENSYKYSREEIEELARASGLELLALWHDPRGLFSLSLLSRQGP